jgi:hypothetical protein
MKDAKIRYRPAELQVVVDHGLRAFCLTNANLEVRPPVAQPRVEELAADGTRRSSGPGTTKAPLCRVYISAPERTRTSTNHRFTRPSTVTWGRQIRPGPAKSTILRARGRIGRIWRGVCSHDVLTERPRFSRSTRASQPRPGKLDGRWHAAGPRTRDYRRSTVARPPQRSALAKAIKAEDRRTGLLPPARGGSTVRPARFAAPAPSSRCPLCESPAKYLVGMKR